MVNTHRRPYFSIKNDRKLANFEHFYQEEAEQRTQSYRKASRPLVPENKTELAKWEPRVMSPEGIVDIARQCIEVTDAFIHLDNYSDQNKQYNSSNLEHLRQQLRQKNSLKDVHPSSYIELIAQCEANPGKFPGTFYCLQLVLGKKQLSEYIRNKGWTEQQLREWNITNDLLSFNKEMDNINATETNSSSIVLNNNEKQENEVESSGGIEFYTY